MTGDEGFADDRDATEIVQITRCKCVKSLYLKRVLLSVPVVDI